MTDYGLVSIITPSYNCAKYIGETIEAIKSQTYENWELLIVDDCSSDNSMEIIQGYAKDDPRIKLFKLDKNSGPGVARNLAIEKSSGNYIAMCDSDDIWLPNKLEKQLMYMDDNNILAVYASSYTALEDGTIDGIYIAFKKQTYQDVCNGDRMASNTIMYNSGKLGKIYMPTLKKRQDWGWKIYILQKAGYALGMVEPLAIYRKRNNSVSSQKSSLIKYNVAVYQDVLHYNIIRAWIKFIFHNIPNIIFKKFRRKIINI